MVDGTDPRAVSYPEPFLPIFWNHRRDGAILNPHWG